MCLVELVQMYDKNSLYVWDETVLIYKRIVSEYKLNILFFQYNMSNIKISIYVSLISVYIKVNPFQNWKKSILQWCYI